MEKWQTGDMDAFEALFRQHERLVFSNAYLITGSKEEAEDVLQEVFFSVWKSRHTFNPEKGKLTTWLHRITVNQCMRRQRKKQPAVRSLDSLEPRERQRLEGREEVLVNYQKYDRLLEAMNSLDSKHRSVLVLRYFNDLSYDEVAQALSIPLGTVKSRINQALRSLREQVGTQQSEAST